MLAIPPCRERGDLCDAARIKSHAHFVQGLNHVGGADAVANAKTGQTVCLGKSSQDQDRLARSHVIQRARIFWVIHIFEVGFIQDHQRVPGNSIHERVEFPAAHHRSRRIIGIRNHNETGLRGDPPSHCLKVEAIIFHGCRDQAHTRYLSKLVVNDERCLRGEHFHLRPEQRVIGHRENVTRTRTDNNLIHGNVEIRGQLLAQVVATVIRVECDVL